MATASSLWDVMASTAPPQQGGVRVLQGEPPPRASASKCRSLKVSTFHNVTIYECIYIYIMIKLKVTFTWQTQTVWTYIFDMKN